MQEMQDFIRTKMFNRDLIHTQESFLNLINPNQFWIVITLSRWTLHQTEFRLANQSENSNCNPIFWFGLTGFIKDFSVCIK